MTALIHIAIFVVIFFSVILFVEPFDKKDTFRCFITALLLFLAVELGMYGTYLI